MGKRTALYRHFDADGALLYVGIALSPTYRLSTHRASSAWAQSIAHVTMEWFETRDEALAAEKRAIETEGPKHNIAHNKPSGGARSTARATVPAVPDVLHSKEEVAVHFRIGYALVQKLIADGMPRTQIGAKKFSYDAGVIRLWLKARDPHQAEIAARAQARKEELRIGNERAAERKAQEDALMMEKMREALSKIGATK